MQSKKTRILKFLSYLPLGWLTKPIYAGAGSILFMHKVIDQKVAKPRISLMEANEIEVAFLEKMLIYLKKKGYEFLSLDEMNERLHSATKTKHKFIVCTFDDGYKDNLTLAYPIFKKHKIPFTIYVTNSYPNGTAKLWWYMLEDILLANDVVTLLTNDGGRQFKTLNQDEKDRAFMEIRSLIISASPEVQEQIFQQLEEQYNKKLSRYVERETLNWNEIRQLAQDELVTIAAHSMNHLTFNTLTEQEMQWEVSQSKEELEAQTQKEVIHFAYPFGTANEINQREVDLLQSYSGVATATTTRMGNIFMEHKNFLHALPRIQILGSQQDLGILELYLSGLLPAIKNRFKKVVTL